MTARIDFKSFDDAMKTRKPGEEAQVWVTWSSRLKRWLGTIDNLTAAQQKNFLLLSCGEPAYTAREDANHPLDDVIRLIGEHFKLQQTPQLARHQLSRAVQEPAESIHDFLQRLERLAAAGGSTDQAETAVLDAVASGCRSLELKKYVLSNPPPTLNDVLRHGRMLEELEVPSSRPDVLTIKPSTP